MPKSKRLVVALAVVMILAAALRLLVQEPAGPGITRMNYTRIENGMGRAEVEVLLGGPPTHVGVGGLASASGAYAPAGEVATWDGGSIMIQVSFDASRKVEARAWVGPSDRFGGMLHMIDGLIRGQVGNGG